ncbi:hypothetical protein EST38_g12432 [Candolleomyces aberdarensis]|uniref:DUF6534 domain-containing protein n=1 Tax=Candolleomyces aberdarensis TaxID=2316362 RepID=A0A4Q2D508_9AGAR|nr:hypothetical protein EST38_g12432 [Candolleomyces aberdarensis]
MAESVDVGKTFGALMVGGIIATLFCGITQAQVFVFFKLYPNDRFPIKLLVLAVWILDTLHTVFITHSLWDHLIDHFGDVARIDWVPWSLALTIALTAVLTFGVHWFFIYRIYRLSDNNIWICIPLAMMACARVVTTVKLVTLRSLTEFVRLYTWSFTSGLTLSSVLDIFITALMCWLLRRRQNKNSSMNYVLDALMLYTFENGAITMAATCMSLITWLTMPHNLIFMGIHFVISKFYANSLLTTLNTRQNLKPGHRTQNSASTTAHKPIMFTEIFKQTHLKQFSTTVHDDGTQSTAPKLQVSVDRETTTHASSTDPQKSICEYTWKTEEDDAAKKV